MAADESKKEAQTGSGAAQETNPPPTPYAEEETKRIGTREDIRSTGGESGGDTSEQPDNLRNGT